MEKKLEAEFDRREKPELEGSVSDDYFVSGFRIKSHNVEFVRNDGFWLIVTQPHI